MAKLSISRIFEASAVIESFKQAKVEGVEGFIEYLSDLSDNVIRALRGQLTITDNMFAEERQLNFKTGVQQSLGLQKSANGKFNPKYVRVGKVIPFTAQVISLQWQMNMEGTMDIIVNFTGLPAAEEATVFLVIDY